MATDKAFVKGMAATRHIGGFAQYSENVLDFAEKNVTASDVVQAIKLPPGALVTQVRALVETVEGSVVTGEVGDTDDPNGYQTALDLNALGNSQVSSGAGYYKGQHYPMGGTIDIVPSADLSAAKVRIIAEYLLLEK